MQAGLFKVGVNAPLFVTSIIIELYQYRINLNTIVATKSKIGQIFSIYGTICAMYHEAESCSRLWWAVVMMIINTNTISKQYIILNRQS